MSNSQIHSRLLQNCFSLLQELRRQGSAQPEPRAVQVAKGGSSWPALPGAAAAASHRPCPAPGPSRLPVPTGGCSLPRFAPRMLLSSSW